MADRERWREDRDRDSRHDEDRRPSDAARRAYGGSSGGRFDPGGRGDQGHRGREVRPETRDREGFWGRGHDDRGFGSERGRDYSREDYGATDYGPDPARQGRGDTSRQGRGSYAESFSRTGEEGRGGQGYGSQRADFGEEASGRSFAGNEGRGFGYGSDYRHQYGGGGHGGGDGGREGYGTRGGDRDRGFFAKAADEVSSWFGDRDAGQRREQDHRGRGPKGYRRSDGRIQEDINDRMTEDPYVDASEIDVSVSNGEVTLSGTVDSRSARRRAEDIADQVSGVSYVQNNLRVGSAQSGQGASGSAASTDRAAEQGGVGQSEAKGSGLGGPGTSGPGSGGAGLTGAAMAGMGGNASSSDRNAPNGDRPRSTI